MESHMNMILILVFCFSIIESIPSPEEEGRYGTQQPSNWPKNPSQPRQYQNNSRLQNFYPAVNNTSNRNYNQDYRAYERSYDNRYSTVPHGQGEKRPFYEGANGRNRSYNQPVSTTTNGLNFKEKSSLDAVPQSYRPTRQYEYDDRNNGRYSPQVEKNHPQPIYRPYYNPRIPYQRSMSENVASRYRVLSQPQRSGYFEKQIMPQNRPASPVDFRYPAQNPTLDPMPETFKPSPNEVRFIPSDAPTTPEPRPEINKVLSDPRIKKYLESNNKKYLVLHSNGKVEHVNSLDSIVQQYPNYVIVKAGDIVTNPKNSSLELKPPTLRGETLSATIPKAMQQIKQNDLPTYGYNARVPYVTEKAYAQPISRPVNIPHEDDAKFNDARLIVMNTPASIDNLTPLVETIAEYGTVIPLFKTSTEYGKPDITSGTPIPFVETTTEYVTYAYSTSESAESLIPITIEDEHQTFTEMPVEILSEDFITDAQFLVTTKDDSTMTNILLTKNNIIAQEEKKNDSISNLRELYPSVFGNFIRQHFGIIPAGNNLNTATNDQRERRLENEESATDPFIVTNLIEVITELAANLSNTERADVSFNDDSNTSLFTDDLIDTKSIPTSSLYDDDQTAYPDIPITFSENEELVKPHSLNEFMKKNDDIGLAQYTEHINNRHRYPSHRNTTDNSYYSVPSEDNDDKTVIDNNINKNNPFISFGDLYADPSSEDETVYSTETEIYDPSNPFSVKREENIINQFFESFTTDISKQRTRIKNTQRFKSMTENNREYYTNPFFELLNTNNNGTPTKGILEYFQDPLDEKENKSIVNPFMDTNPFNDELQNLLVTNEGDAQNPFTENYAGEITLSQTEFPIANDIPLVFEESENIYEPNIIPFLYLPSDNGAYELTTTPITDYDINTISGDFNDFHDETTEDIIVLTTTEKSTVWFKTVGDFWTNLSNGTIPYNRVYFFPVPAQPLVEKDTKTTIFPNGTIVQEFIETVWKREGDTSPILVKSTRTLYPDEEP